MEQQGRSPLDTSVTVNEDDTAPGSSVDMATVQEDTDCLDKTMLLAINKMTKHDDDDMTEVKCPKCDQVQG